MRHLSNAEAAAFDEHGLQVLIPVIFDSPATTGALGASGMASSQPSVLMTSAGVCTDPVGWALTIKGVAYVVAAAEPDGTGLTRLTLELA